MPHRYIYIWVLHKRILFPRPLLRSTCVYFVVASSGYLETIRLLPKKKGKNKGSENKKQIATHTNTTHTYMYVEWAVRRGGGQTNGRTGGGRASQSHDNCVVAALADNGPTSSDRHRHICLHSRLYMRVLAMSKITKNKVR